MGILVGSRQDHPGLASRCTVARFEVVHRLFDIRHQIRVVEVLLLLLVLVSGAGVDADGWNLSAYLALRHPPVELDRVLIAQLRSISIYFVDAAVRRILARWFLGRIVSRVSVALTRFVFSGF